MNRTHIPGRDERFRSTNADSVVGNVIAVLLVMGIAILAGLSVELAGWTDLTLPVVVIAALAALVGSALAKSPWPDSLAHLVAIGSGIGLTLFLTLRQVVPAEETVGRMARVQELGRAAVDWYLGNPLDERLEAQLISFLMATILWLVSYLSAWCLLRRGWVLATVLLPGFFILVNLGFAEVSSASLLTAYGLLSLLLLVRQNMLDREAWWRRRGLNASDRPGSLALVWGSILAVVATLIAVVAPASVSQATLQPLMAEVGRQATTMQESAAEFLERVTGDARDGQVKVSGNYSSFGDSFAIGGPLELGDKPEVVVAADSAPNLTAQTFDA